MTSLHVCMCEIVVMSGPMEDPKGQTPEQGLGRSEISLCTPVCSL